MPNAFDPSWGVPLLAIVLVVAGITWAKLSARAHERKFGLGKYKRD